MVVPDAGADNESDEIADDQSDEHFDSEQLTVEELRVAQTERIYVPRTGRCDRARAVRRRRQGTAAIRLRRVPQTVLPKSDQLTALLYRIIASTSRI